MELKIYKAPADFNTSKLGNIKDCVIVEFPNCISSTTNKPFKWMPTYQQLEQIHHALHEIERESWKNEDIISWKCPNCHKDAITSLKIKTYLCGCGEYMKQI